MTQKNGSARVGWSDKAHVKRVRSLLSIPTAELTKDDRRFLVLFLEEPEGKAWANTGLLPDGKPVRA